MLGHALWWGAQFYRTGYNRLYVKYMLVGINWLVVVENKEEKRGRR